VACTNLLTYYFLGDRSLKTFDAFVFPDLSGSVIVHDRYQDYDAIPGVVHQLCCARILRDLEDAAQAYPGAIWPGQAADALRALIHAANIARAKGLAAAPDDDIVSDLRLFRNAVRVGLAQVRRVPGANTRQRPGRLLLECPDKREADVLRFLTDLGVPPTSNQAERDPRRRKPSRRPPGAPLGDRDPAQVRPPRVHLHCRQAWPGHHHRPLRRPRREPPGCRPSRRPYDLPASSYTAQRQ
jgi:transposase